MLSFTILNLQAFKDVEFYMILYVFILINTFIHNPEHLSPITYNAKAKTTAPKPVSNKLSPPIFMIGAPLLVPFVVPFELELVAFGLPDTVAVVTVTPVAFLQVLLSGFVAVLEKVISTQLYNPPSESPFVIYSRKIH